MQRLLALLILAPLGACAKGDIPVPPSGPARQDALCAISFAQWLGINSHEPRLLGRGERDGNALVRLGSAEPPIAATCEITPDYAIVSMTTEPARVTTSPDPVAP